MRRFYNNNTTKDTGNFAFANMAAFLAGTANTFTVTLGDVSSAIAQGALGVFVQDNYKVRPILTLELGFRYDWLMSPTERFDRFVDYVPEINSLVQVNNGIAPVYHTNARNFQPRLGFAWDPFKDGKTSIRGAYAILADQPITNLVTGNAANPPFATAVALPANTTTQLFNASCQVGCNAAPGSTVSPSSSGRDIIPHALAPGILADVILEHREHRLAFAVGDGIERLADLLDGFDLLHDRVRRGDGVEVHGGFTPLIRPRSGSHSGRSALVAFVHPRWRIPRSSQRSFHHAMVTRSPNHWCAISCASTA